MYQPCHRSDRARSEICVPSPFFTLLVRSVPSISQSIPPPHLSSSHNSTDGLSISTGMRTYPFFDRHSTDSVSSILLSFSFSTL
ncbi:hypothetical protein PGTUg99_002531 [Puccinia graminis f. sp. tritici]|uniref:Uncharacterized protein n=1 Tax=Puccinia graminis f. sp. tritici TaxID=56615 RepID=A0A5B0QH59_PUCGR|nr:hypothetical protein PGTUg99_002531 [Puccinia graminis f. sp. tritici]